jgi:hypothetical protein
MQLAAVRIVRTPVMVIRNPIAVTVPVGTIGDTIVIPIAAMCVTAPDWNRDHHACGHKYGKCAEQHDNFLHMASSGNSYHSDLSIFLPASKGIIPSAL